MSSLVLPWSTLAAGDLETSAREFRALAESDADAGPAWAQLTFVLWKLGRNQECAQAYAKARTFYPPGTDVLMDGWLIGEMIVEAGADSAAKLAAFWRAEAKRRYIDPYNLAIMYTALGDDKLAFEYLRESVRERSPSVFFLAVEPWFLSIKDRPEYRDLLRAMNLQ
jgi:tetratricopeptide (TPR) repeat protein